MKISKVFLVLAALSICLACGAGAAETTLVAPGSTWRYLDDGSDQGTSWRNPGFDDAAWASGPAQLGYGDGDEATVVSFGPDSNSKFITTYFRQTFTVADPGAFLRADLRLLRDDGAVVYLNGTEVARSNLPGGGVSTSTTAAAAVSGAEESAFFDVSVDPALLIAGSNLLAVEIHQSGASSSDISFDLELTGSDASTTVSRGPYLQVGTPTSVVVRWRTDAATDSRVRYGTDPGSLSLFADGGGVTAEHVVTLSGLSPETRYYYSVGTSAQALAGGDSEHFFVTGPLAGQARSTRVWVIGDSGTADANARAVRDAFDGFTGGQYPNLWLMLGDNAYNDGTDLEYQAAVFDTYPARLRQTVLWPTLGNHDGFTADSASQSGPYYDIFTLPTQGEAGGVPSGTEAYYSFDYANIHFICLESYETDRSTNGAMLTWLEDDLASTTADWIIAFWHHPPYTKGSHNSDSETRLVEMRQNALPILEAYGVDLVLAGHSHSYERSFLADGHYGNSGSLDPSMILDSGDGRADGDGFYQKPTFGLAPHEGTVYAVAGSSGKISGGSLNHPVMYLSISELGSMVLDIDGNVLDARFLRDDGAERDRFTLVKGNLNTVCGNGVRELGEACDGADLGGASCGDGGCTAGTLSCTASCELDFSTCTGCPICDNDGVCEVGENCNGCPGDCPSGAGASCGNGLCEAANGEDCLSCDADCRGQQGGKPSGRFCCGDGDGQNPLSCSSSTCTAAGFLCTDVASVPSCCGDGQCTGSEDVFSCSLDCGAPPVCGDGSCDSGEDECNCAGDCGAPPVGETVGATCSDGVDNDCDLLTDCADSDCALDPACSGGCGQPDEACQGNGDCCSNKCRGPSGAKTCR